MAFVRKSDRKYYCAMGKVAFWAVLMILVALFVSYYLDTPVPPEIEESWKVKIIDASMRTYNHLIRLLVKLGITEHFSWFDRKLADWFILAQMTGRTWGLRLNADVLKINDTVVDGVRVVVYEPVFTYEHRKRKALVFLHGGGWSTLSVDSYDPLVRKIARGSGVVIFSVNYRQSPEYPYPVPFQDSLKIVNYVIDNASDLRIDSNRVAVGGDSCGGNLAAAIALRLREKIAMQLLIVPSLQFFNWKTTSFFENSKYFHDSINSPASLVLVTNYLGISPSYYVDFLENNHTSRSLKRSHLASRVDQTLWMRPEFVRNKDLIDSQTTNLDHGNEELSDKIEELITDPYVAPLMADDRMLRSVARAYIVTCGYDFIRDDGVMYAERLKFIGNHVVHKHYPAGFHHSWFYPHGPLRLKVGVEIVADIVRYLNKRL